MIDVNGEEVGDGNQPAGSDDHQMVFMLEIEMQPGQVKEDHVDIAGCRKPAALLRIKKPEHIVFEATGPYHRTLEKAFVPNQVWSISV